MKFTEDQIDDIINVLSDIKNEGFLSFDFDLQMELEQESDLEIKEENFMKWLQMIK